LLVWRQFNPSEEVVTTQGSTSLREGGYRFVWKKKLWGYQWELFWETQKKQRKCKDAKVSKKNQFLATKRGNGGERRKKEKKKDQLDKKKVDMKRRGGWDVGGPDQRAAKNTKNHTGGKYQTKKEYGEQQKGRGRVG